MKYNDDYKMLVNTRKAATEDINAAKLSYFPTVDLVSSYVQNNPSGSAKKVIMKMNLKRVSMSVSTFLMGSEIQPRKEKWWQVTRRQSCK